MIRVSLDASKIKVSFHYAGDYVRRIRAVPGAFFNRDEVCWEVPLKSFAALEKSFKGEIVYMVPRSVITGEPDPDYYTDIVPAREIHTFTPLYDFQKFGASFLCQRALKEGFAFLCDATGVGKTSQALGALLLLKQVVKQPRTLVVTPAAVRHQWVADAVPKFLGSDASVIEVEGSQKQRLRAYGAAEITVTNYEALLRDAHLLAGVQFDLVIFDECQRLKNQQGKTYRAVKKMLGTMPGVVCFFLTATPVMNDLDELYALFDLARPGFLGKYNTFTREHMRIDYSPGYPRLIGYKNLDKLASRVAPFILRRTEAHPEVAASLPKLVTQNLYVEATAEQRRIHDYILTEWTEAMQERGVAKAPQDIEALEARCRGYIVLMQGASDDLRLFTMSESSMAKKYAKMCSVSSSASPKLKVLIDLVDDLVPQGKVIVFTCFERMARLIAEALDKYNPGLFTGKNKEVRNDELMRFWHDPCCQVLVLTDAGGAGLNLQKARFVVNYDVPWSPGQLEQRYGRIKRFGSDHTSLLAINLVTRNTIDERILRALERKGDIFKTIIAETLDNDSSVSRTRKVQNTDSRPQEVR